MIDHRAGDSVAEQFRRWVDDPSFSCVGAKSVIHRGTYCLKVYDRLAGLDATDRLANDLMEFVDRQDPASSNFSTFAASFRSNAGETEEQFEAFLWEQLQALHGRDACPWDPDVSSDPAHGSFAFSFAGRAFFVVGLHPAASRLSRRFVVPTLVFNARFQFERLRENGGYARMQDVIRRRELALQGSINPMLSDFGTRSEARQYSGRQLEEGWVCPFHAQPNAGPPAPDSTYSPP